MTAATRGLLWLAFFGLLVFAVYSSGFAPPARAAEDCTIIPGGTIGDPEPEPIPDRAGSPTDKGPGAHGPNPTVNGLPTRVDLHSGKASQNRNYYFAVKSGRLFVKPNYERTGKRGNWQHVPAPACLDGDIQSIDADDDELTAINSRNQIFGMDQALSIPSRFNWTSRWGFPVWLGDGYTIPKDTVAWAWTVISPRESRYWVDPAGNRHTVGEGKVSHVLSLRGDHRRITMNDPWLPQDRSYEVCGPRRGTFRISNLAASGSVLFVIGSHGDMYTRLWDFDIAGLDNAFFDYSYADQRGVENPAIQLPGAHWVQQPKIHGKITNRISIFTVGRGTLHRTLRVEGRNAKGVHGFWQKDLYTLNRGSAGWKFVPTPKAKLTGRAIPNPPGDTSSVGAGKAEGYRYISNGDGYRAEIPDFNVSCGRALLKVSFDDGKSLDLNLFLDDMVRVYPRARGLDGTPRYVLGTIEVTPRARATGGDGARNFIRDVLGDRKFTTAQIIATTSGLEIPDLGLQFSAADSQSSGRVPDQGFDRLALKGRKLGLAFTIETATESPANIVVSRIGDKGRGRVAARLTRSGSFFWNPRRLADGRYRVKVSSMGLGGRLANRWFFVRRKLGHFSVTG
ncbi:MAG: hypothetical protein KDB54_03170 [Solirubrobacterales bacterium]|nr:hypothetical protein [Solirubrobacterales bacterium]